jgi:hypothetical protein
MSFEIVITRRTFSPTRDLLLSFLVADLAGRKLSAALYQGTASAVLIALKNNGL